MLPTPVELDSISPSVRPSTPRPSAASLSMTTMPTQSGTDKVPPAPNITLDVSALPNTSSPSLSSSPTSSPLNETTTTEATFSKTQVDKEDDDETGEESTTTTATTSTDLWSSFDDTSTVVIDLLGSSSEGLNDTNSSENGGMNDTESIDDKGSTSTEQNIPTSAPQSSSISANKELDHNVDKSTQEKEGLSSGATAGIIIVVLLVIGLGAAYLIHRRKEKEDQASSDSLDDEEAGLDLAEDDIDSATREASNREGFGGMNDLRLEPPSPIRSVTNSDDNYIGVIVDE